MHRVVDVLRIKQVFLLITQLVINSIMFLMGMLVYKVPFSTPLSLSYYTAFTTPFRFVFNLVFSDLSTISTPLITKTTFLYKPIYNY